MIAARHRLTGLADEASPDLASQIACHRALGWDALELRSVDGQPVGAMSRDRLSAVAEALRSTGMTVPVIATRIGNWGRDIADPFEDDLDELDRLMSMGETLGTWGLRVMSYPSRAPSEPAWEREVVRRLRELSRRAADRGMTVLHENCAGWGGRSPDHLRRLAEALDVPGFGLLLDLGNGPSYGYDGLAMLQAVVDRVRHVHVKDARRDADADGGVRFVVPGEGDCAIAAALGVLERSGYCGMYAIEPHLHLQPHADRRARDANAARADYERCAHATAELLARVSREREREEASHAV